MRPATKKRSAPTPAARAHVVGQQDLVLTLQMRGDSLDSGAGERALRSLHVSEGDCVLLWTESEATPAWVLSTLGDRVRVELWHAPWFPDELARGATIKPNNTVRRAAV